jgi:hypothetical protein
MSYMNTSIPVPFSNYLTLTHMLVWTKARYDMICGTGVRTYKPALKHVKASSTCQKPRHIPRCPRVLPTLLVSSYELVSLHQ